MENELKYLINRLKAGFVNGIFKHPSLIITHMRWYICPQAQLVSVKDNSFIVHLQSNEWEKTKYSVMVEFKYEEKENGTKKIIEVTQID